MEHPEGQTNPVLEIGKNLPENNTTSSTPESPKTTEANTATKEKEKSLIEEIKEKLAKISKKQTVEPSTSTTKETMKADYFDSSYFSKGPKGKVEHSGYILGYEVTDDDGFWSPVVKAINKYLPNETDRKHLVDVGCAYGYLLKRMAPLFEKTSGIDISGEALKKAAISSPTSELHKVDLSENQLPFEKDSVDAIVLSDVIEHVNDPYDIIRQAHEQLKPGGIAFISTPDVGNWFGKFIASLNVDKSHISLLSQKELLTNLDQIGFDVLEKQVFFPLGPIRVPVPANLEIVVRKRSTT